MAIIKHKQVNNESAESIQTHVIYIYAGTHMNTMRMTTTNDVNLNMLKARHS